MDIEQFQSAIELAVSVAVFLAPVPFLAAVVAGAFIANARGGLGALGSAVVSVTGGVMLGTLLLVEVDLLVRLPLVLLVLGIAVARWRAGRRWQAGWIIVGAALPWTVVYGVITAVTFAGDIPYELAPTLGLLALGAIPFALGLALVSRGDPPQGEPRMDARAGQPGSRDIGSIAHAIREPSFVGPFGLQEISMLVAIIVVSLTVPFLVRDLPVIVRILVVAGAASVVGAEAYIRALTTRSRRAFEAFSWLGEWELTRARGVIGRVPLSRDEAIDWIVAHPIGPIAIADELPIRIEIELLAGRRDEARALVEQLPTGSPWARFEQAALRDLVDWRAGGDGHLDLMDETAREILPADGDERLRADVTIAVAKVRRLMADGRATAGDAAQPLVDIRELLGSRADGQVGRALRRRLIPLLFVVILVLTIIGEIMGGPI